MVSEKPKLTPESADNGIDNAAVEKIHVMPQRFYVAPKKRNTGLIIIIVVGVLLIGGLVGVAIYLNQSLNRAQVASPAANPPAVDVNANANANQNVNQNMNSNANVNDNSNLNVAELVPTSSLANVEPPADVNANANVNANVNANPEPPARPLPPAFDEDGDQLTVLEEQLYVTDPKKSDTDKDGFSDGDELLNGYDPLRGNRATLANSGLFSAYANNLFSIIYPKKWRVKEQASDGTEILFVAGNGEFVEVLVVDNSKNLDLAAWYKSEYPAGDLATLTPVTIGGISGLHSADGLTYYFLSKDKSRVYLVNYNVGDSVVLNFGATFTVMVKNFKMLK